jgi:hypothetical protein
VLQDGKCVTPVALNPGRSQFINSFGLINTFVKNATMDLVLEGGAFIFKTVIDYFGLNVVESRIQNYINGIEKYWNVRNVTIDGKEYPIKFDVEFLDANSGRHSNANALIEINMNTCRSNYLVWCFAQDGELVSSAQQEQLAAHEFGHLALGLTDEYYDSKGRQPTAKYQIEQSDLANNVCEYNRTDLQGNQLPARGDWCKDMMALGTLTNLDRYWDDIESYLIGNSNRPDMVFGFAPLNPEVFDVPVERMPGEQDIDIKSVPEPSGLLLFAVAGLALVAVQRRRG